MGRLAPVLCVVLALSGCVSTWAPRGAVTRPDYQVTIHCTRSDGTTTEGQGVLISPGRVMTVEHVAPDPHAVYVVERGGRRVRAYFLRKRTRSSIEALVVLRLSAAIPVARYPKLRPIKPGDSGSPILGQRGEIVGLITGHAQAFSPPGCRTVLGTMGPRPFDRITGR